MKRLEVSCAVRPLYGSLGAKGLSESSFYITRYVSLPSDVAGHLTFTAPCILILIP